MRGSQGVGRTRISSGDSRSTSVQGRRRQSVYQRHGQRHGRSISWSWCEIVVDGLSLFNGSQLAVDTTLVSPMRRDGTARPGPATTNGAESRFARKDKERTFPELTSQYGGCRLVVLAGSRRQVVSRDGSIGPCQGPASAQVLLGKGSQSLDDLVERDPRMHGPKTTVQRFFCVHLFRQTVGLFSTWGAGPCFAVLQAAFLSKRSVNPNNLGLPCSRVRRHQDGGGPRSGVRR